VSALFDAEAQADASNAKLRWELKLDIANGSDQLTGTLRASFTQEQENATGDGNSTDLEGTSFPVVFTRTDGPVVSPTGDACATVADGQEDAAS
jgi:hypothetical protein